MCDNMVRILNSLVDEQPDIGKEIVDTNRLMRPCSKPPPPRNICKKM